MEQKNKLVVIDVEELEAIIERVVERKLLEILKHDNKSLGRDGRLSLKDVMKALDVSKQTIYNWIKLGRLPQPARIGRRLYWSEDSIRAMMP